MEGRGKMIEFSELIIGSVEDYDKLYDYVGKEAIDDYAGDQPEAADQADKR